MTGGLDITNLFVFFIIMVISVTLHEAMHGFTAHWLGDDTAEQEGRLTLNPLKSVDLVTTILLPVVMVAVGAPPIFAAKPVPFNPYKVKFYEWGAALVGLVGPFTNLALAVAMALFIRIFGGGFDFTLQSALVLFVQVNIGLFVFNMIPIPPLDGSRLLYAVAPEPVQEFMARFERMGIIVVIIILLVLMPFISPILSSMNQAILRTLL